MFNTMLISEQNLKKIWNESLFIEKFEAVMKVLFYHIKTILASLISEFWR